MSTPFPRSQRLAIHIPLTYRIPGDDRWTNSLVQNISDSGVLFGPTTLRPGTEVEVMFSTPTDIGKLGSGKQLCAAEVVRTTDTGDAAVRFEECRFLLDS
jgi:hypothetical protein